MTSFLEGNLTPGTQTILISVFIILQQIFAIFAPSYTTSSLILVFLTVSEKKFTVENTALSLKFASNFSAYSAYAMTASCYIHYSAILMGRTKRLTLWYCTNTHIGFT